MKCERPSCNKDTNEKAKKKVMKTGNIKITEDEKEIRLCAFCTSSLYGWLHAE